MHVVYGGAHLFKPDTILKLGAIARRTLEEYAPAADDARRRGRDRLPPSPTASIRALVDKLTREPVEDFRIDFEDGFGNRPDDEEDRLAVDAARHVAAAAADGALPPCIGIRIKPLSEELKRRSLRTLDLFVTSLLDATGGVAAAELRRHAAEDHDRRRRSRRWRPPATPSSTSARARRRARSGSS